jgi:hypothetical protein
MRAVLLSIVASMRLKTDLTIKGARQGKTRQAPKIKSITLMRVLNPPNVENHFQISLQGFNLSKPGLEYG